MPSSLFRRTKGGQLDLVVLSGILLMAVLSGWFSLLPGRPDNRFGFTTRLRDLSLVLTEESIARQIPERHGHRLLQVQRLA